MAHNRFSFLTSNNNTKPKILYFEIQESIKHLSMYKTVSNLKATEQNNYYKQTHCVYKNTCKTLGRIY